MEELTKDDWDQWRSNAITRSFFEMLAERREEAIAQLAYGHVTSTSKKDITIGAINAYTHILATRFKESVNE